MARAYTVTVAAVAVLVVVVGTAAYLVVANVGEPAVDGTYGSGAEITKAVPEGEIETSSAAEGPLPEAIDSEPAEQTEAAPLPLRSATLASDPETPDPAYLGIWASDPAACSGIGGAQGLMEITGEHFGGYDEPCRFAEVASVGMSRWRAVLQCEGENPQRDVTLRAEGSQLHVTYHDAADQNVAYTRCVPQ